MVGGLAVGVRSEPRFTRDIDLAVAATTDRDAERVVRDLGRRGYSILRALEHQVTGRLATVRFLPPGEEEDGVVLDLLFGSCGVEAEIVADATSMEPLSDVHGLVASTGALIAMKLLSRKDSRPKDTSDLVELFRVATPDDLARARDLCLLIVARGTNRGKDLAADLESSASRWHGRRDTDDEDGFPGL